MIKIGSTVKLLSDGGIYTTYDEQAEHMGLDGFVSGKGGGVRYHAEVADCGVVMCAAPHLIHDDVIVYGIHMANGDEIMSCESTYDGQCLKVVEV